MRTVIAVLGNIGTGEVEPASSGGVGDSRRACVLLGGLGWIGLIVWVFVGERRRVEGGEGACFAALDMMSRGDVVRGQEWGTVCEVGYVICLGISMTDRARGCWEWWLWERVLVSCCEGLEDGVQGVGCAMV